MSVTPPRHTAPAPRLEPFGASGYRHDLRMVLIQMAPPYGFTLATFTAAGITTYSMGAPHPLEILMFLGGAFLGYALLALIAGAIPRLLTPQGITMQGWQMLHILPLGTVFLTAWGLTQVVPDPWAWLVNGAVLTIGYLSVLTAELAFLAIGSRGRR